MIKEKAGPCPNQFASYIKSFVQTNSADYVFREGTSYKIVIQNYKRNLTRDSTL